MDKKILLTAALSAALMCTPLTVLAADGEEASKKSFTIDQAIDYMYENSLVLKSQEENITSCQYKQDADRITRKSLKGYTYSTSTFDYYLVGSGYAEYADQKQLEIAQRSLTQSKFQLKMQLESQFYSCINADKKISVAKDALDNAIENNRIAQEKRDSGIIGSIEADSFSLAVIAAQNNYDDALRNKDYLTEQLKLSMSYPEDEDISVTGEFVRQEMNSTTSDEAIEKSKESVQMLNLNDGIDIQRELFKTYSNFYAPTQYQYQTQKYSLAKEEASYDNNVRQLKLGIISAYNTMANAYSQLDYIDKAISLKEEQKEAQKISYELGLSTASEYITSVQELDELMLNRVDAEIGAYLASQSYELTFE